MSSARTSFASPCASAADEDLDVDAMSNENEACNDVKIVLGHLLYISSGAKAKSRNEYMESAPIIKRF